LKGDGRRGLPKIIGKTALPTGKREKDGKKKSWLDKDGDVLPVIGEHGSDGLTRMSAEAERDRGRRRNWFFKKICRGKGLKEKEEEGRKKEEPSRMKGGQLSEDFRK